MLIKTLKEQVDIEILMVMNLGLIIGVSIDIKFMFVLLMVMDVVIILLVHMYKRLIVMIKSGILYLFVNLVIKKMNLFM